MDPRIRIRIHTKMSWIPNTAFFLGNFFYLRVELIESCCCPQFKLWEYRGYWNQFITTVADLTMYLPFPPVLQSREPQEPKLNYLPEPEPELWITAPDPAPDPRFFLSKTNKFYRKNFMVVGWRMQKYTILLILINLYLIRGKNWLWFFMVF